MLIGIAWAWNEEIREGRLREALRLNCPSLLSALRLDYQAGRGQWKPELADRGYIPHSADVLRAMDACEREQWWQWYDTGGSVDNAMLAHAHNPAV